MPVKVSLSFSPPVEPDISKLNIWEAPAENGPWTLIEQVVNVGTYPDYISHHTTPNATSVVDWFAIQWEDATGATTDLSAPLRGGTDTLVDKIVKRVEQRDPTLISAILVQEAEAAIQSFYGESVDPYDPLLANVSYKTLNGFTYLVLARALISRVIQQSSSASGNVNQATLGLVSFKTDTSTQTAVKSIKTDVQPLIDMANKELGLSTSFIMQLEEVTTNLGLSSFDHSRLIGWVGLE